MKTDLEIQKDVTEEFVWDPSVDAENIEVNVKNGVVNLSGTVNSYLEKIAAEKAAAKVSGVKAIAVDLVVKLKSDKIRSDNDLAEAVLNALKWHSAMEEDRIRIKVEEGWVTLEGSVDWEFQKNSAQSMVEPLTGIRGITNNLKTLPVVNLTDVKRQIKSAFHRSATIDSAKIDVESIGSRVILSGKVRSFAEKSEAEKAAWYTPGVTSVENRLEIDSVYSY
jgi:osmotically-inducible protein OsmY